MCGRMKDLLIIHGKNYYPQDIEFSCCRVPEVKPGAVAAIGVDSMGQEVLVVVLELRNNKYTPQQYQNLAVKLRKVITEDNGVTPFEIVFIDSKTIMKTTSGKIARHAVASAYEKHSLKVLYCASLHESRDQYEEVSENIPDKPLQLMCIEGEQGGVSTEFSSLPSIVDGLDTLHLHGEELETALLEDVCYLCGIQSYMVNPTDSLEMMSLDSLKRAQLKGILEQYYGAEVSTEKLFDVNTTFEQLFQAVDVTTEKEFNI